MKFKFFKKSFTLAEVVMVMGIIGVVAMLTVTNARKETDVAEKVMQLKKCDEILSAAFAQAVGENGNINTWGANGGYPNANEFWDIISSYLKLQKNCGISSGCWRLGSINALYTSKKGSDTIESSSSTTIYRKGILANGASIAVTGSNEIFIDVDGPDKGTYRFGDDVFQFVVNNLGEIHPYGFEHGNGAHILNACITDKGVYCTAWVMTFGNQDYLKRCADKLNWDTKQSCK